MLNYSNQCFIFGAIHAFTISHRPGHRPQGFDDGPASHGDVLLRDENREVRWHVAMVGSDVSDVLVLAAHKGLCLVASGVIFFSL